MVCIWAASQADYYLRDLKINQAAEEIPLSGKLEIEFKTPNV